MEERGAYSNNYIVVDVVVGYDACDDFDAAYERSLDELTTCVSIGQARVSYTRGFIDSIGLEEGREYTRRTRRVKEFLADVKRELINELLGGGGGELSDDDISTFFRRPFPTIIHRLRNNIMAAVTLVDVAPIAESSSLRSAIRFDVIPLPDPANDDESSRDYILVSRDDRGRPSSSSSSSSAGDGTNGSRRRTASTSDIHEVQTVRPNSGRHASYFVGSRVVSDPALHVSTRIDPLFFALAHFHRVGTATGGGEGRPSSRWLPWDQALAGVPPVVLRALDADLSSGVDGAGQLGHLLEVSDMCGDDLILCRFGEDRALRWLVAKFERARGAMRLRLHEMRRGVAERRREVGGMRDGSGAFSSSFTVAEEEGPRVVADAGERKGSVDEGEVTDSFLSQQDELSINVGALQLVCEYIPTEWKSKLSKEVGLTDAEWMGKKSCKSSASTADGEHNTSGDKRPRSSWEGNIGQEDADALLHYTQGCAKSASVITPGEKKEVQNAQSVGLKKLAKVNTKGMKSLSSFFGAGAKKVKK
ncbi:hypothetical protein ACHAW5_002925 [Stephanodiscus triporus]|uniref:Uncharacterized protein n=1 Tax=Stephanodiscus triporus TaxID=2934178 RepID=A0ABD3MZL5_9STRA